MVVAQSESPMFDKELISDIHSELNKAGFAEIQTIHFPQITYPSGWWSATMARRDQKFGDFREQSVIRKPFATKYYNADIHRACSALPQFLLDALDAN